MQVNRVIVRKVSNPKILVELNIEIDQPDGTTKVIQQYADPKSMVMYIHGDRKTITCRASEEAEHYTASYDFFRDELRRSFISADKVLNYTLVNGNVGYTVNRLVNRKKGTTIFA